ncbi:MAG: ABC transporter substrate-binding protein [Armatimonadota bacterium]|nr:ABC transporter substrate-binding protein [Armatimonadota bacterium]MDR7535450.1 ABC transporter substrate-binding protein [Armatimonadota bacterium]
MVNVTYAGRSAVLLALVVVLAGAGLAPAGPAAPPGTLRIAYPQRAVSLDAHGPAAAERISIIIGRHLYDTLVTWDPKAKQFQPALAERWRSVDPTTWEFQLRRGVRFHDGSEFTSAAVKTSLERVVALRGPLTPLFAPVAAVDTPDPYRVVVRTQTPMGTLLSNLTMLYIVPAGTPPTPAFAEKPVGTGPFRFVEFVRDTRVVLEANPTYWRRGIPKLQRLVFVDIPELSARVTALETGEIDMTVQLTPEEIKRLRGNPQIKIEIGPTYYTRFLWINPTRRPFDHLKVRQALQHALNIPAITSSLLAGIAKPARGPIAANVLCAVEFPPRAFNTPLARRLLTEAGYPGGFETELKWNDALPKEREVADAIVGQLALVGIRVKNTLQPRAIWLDDLLKLNWELNLLGTGAVTGDADYTLGRLYHSRARRTGYANPEVDRLLEQAAATVDLNRRCEMYRRVQEILWTEGPAVFLFEALESYAYRTRVQGFTLPPSEIFELSEVTVSP